MDEPSSDHTPEAGETRFDVLTKFHLGAAMQLPAGLFDTDGEVDCIESDFVPRALIHRLTTHVLGKKLPPMTHTADTWVEHEFPASVWQHFKSNHARSWWLGWLVRRRPVRTETTRQRITLTTSWSQFAAFPWQQLVDHLQGGELGLMLGEPSRVIDGPHDTWLLHS